ncbi:hypothetical protein ECG_07193 [Echinococcus granulosus]|nr:hypothetical protein ECG_07193 [Echinococcus granulosus]
MEAFKKLRESDFLIFYELLRQSMRNLCSTGGRVCGKNKYHLPSVITFDHVCNREQPFFVRSHGWFSCDPYLTQTRCGLPCRPLLVGDFCLVIIPSEIARSLSPISQVNSTSSSCIGKAPPLTERMNENFWSSTSPISQNCAFQFNSSASLPQHPLNLK